MVGRWRLRTVCVLYLLVTGCVTAEDLTRNSSGSVTLAYDAPSTAVFAAALEAVGGGEFEIVSQDQTKREIRISRGTYMHGLWTCYGNRLGIFLTPDGAARTQVEIVERYFSRAQLVGCRAQAPAYIERLNTKMRAYSPRGTPGNELAGWEWSIPEGVTETQFKKDRYECLKEAASYQGPRLSSDDFYAACMEGRGYLRTSPPSGWIADPPVKLPR